METIIPRNIDAEEAILGAILIEPEKRLPAARKLLTPDDFTTARYRTVYETILAVHEAGQPIDLLTVATSLKSLDLFAAVGGDHGLLTLMERCHAPSNIKAYCAMVKEASLRRTGMHLARELYLTLKNDPGGLEKVRASNGHYHFSKLLENTAQRGPAMRLSDVIETDTNWLWYPWIPKSELTVISGTPGTMKTFLLIDLAARLTTGRPLPFCETPSEPCNVLHIDAENKKSTIRKRLLAAGGDPERFFILTDEDLGDLGDPYETLKHFVVLHSLKSITIDPLNSFVPDRIERAGKIALRQQLFRPLRRLMDETGVTIVYLCHNRKGGANGVSDSTQLAAGYQEYTSVPRSAILTAKHPEEANHFLLLSSKVNDAPRPQSLIYHVEDHAGTGYMVWDAVTDDYNADNAAFAQPEPPEKKKGRDAMKEFILAELADGAWHKAKEIQTAVREEFGPSSAGTFQRARDELKAAGTIAHKKGSGMKEPHYWCLAGTADQSPAEVSKLGGETNVEPAMELLEEPLDDPYADLSGYEAEGTTV